MGEIKFRLFGKENRIMYSWEEILDFHSLKDTLKYGGEETEYYSPLLQYTGLSDKYGQEIYEGDILRGPKYYESEESTSPVYDQWKVTYKNCSFYLGYSPIEEDLDWIGNECEVIGNVYENPELLEN
ncbi:TPA: YopX family protein [Bacillus cereus]|uniref:YopX family protein n=1 Tax=Bacillus cereus TaxID=1396 RepID=UPI002480BD3B|nr:YopX family protein [Bacillus cereus]MDH8003019.1 YopX family protein [Bacillus cereus]